MAETMTISVGSIGMDKKLNAMFDEFRDEIDEADFRDTVNNGVRAKAALQEFQGLVAKWKRKTADLTLKRKEMDELISDFDDALGDMKDSLGEFYRLANKKRKKDRA